MIKTLLALLLTLVLLQAEVYAVEDLSADERVYVYLKSVARTSGDQILLGDVAQVEGSDQSMVARVSSLPLGPSPQPGGDILLNRENIRRCMVTHRIDPVKVAIAGSDEILITRAGRKVSGREIAALVEDYVQRSWDGRKVRTEVTYSNLPQEINLPENNLEFAVLDPLRSRVFGSSAVSLATMDQGRVVQRVPVSLRARVFETVGVASRDIRQGEVLSPGDFELVEREVSDPRSEPVLSLEQAAGKRLRRNVRRDQIIFLDLLENPPVVERGDEVILVVQYKNIRIGCPGKAWESGGTGDKILVRNQYGRNLTGLVLDSHTIEITPERKN